MWCTCMSVLTNADSLEKAVQQRISPHWLVDVVALVLANGIGQCYSDIIYKKLQTIYLMLYKRWAKNSKNQKYKHERIR